MLIPVSTQVHKTFKILKKGSKKTQNGFGRSSCRLFCYLFLLPFFPTYLQFFQALLKLIMYFLKMLSVITSIFSLARKDLHAKKARFIVGVLSILIGTSFAFLLLVTTTSVFAYVENTVTAGMSESEIKVTPKFAVGFFKVTKEEQRKIDEKALNALKALPGITKVRTEAVLKYPTSLEVALFNTKFITDSPLYGIDDTEFVKFIQTDKNTSDPDVIPVLISKELVDIYNIGIASAISKPMLNEDFLLGFEFDIKLGYSSIFSGSSSVVQATKKGRIVGIAEGIPIIGISLKESDVNKLSERYVDKYVPEYTRVFLEMKDPKQYYVLKKQIEDMGFEAFSFEEQITPVRSQLEVVLYFAGGIVVVVFVLIMLTMFYLFYSQYQEKQYMVALLKVLGARRRDIASFFFYQAGEMVIVGVLCGLLFGYLSTGVLAYVIQSLFSTKNLTLITPWWLPIFLFFLQTGMIALAAYVPISLSRKLEPKEALLEH